MKKILTGLFVFSLMFVMVSFVDAQQKQPRGAVADVATTQAGIHEPGTGLEDPAMKAEGQGTAQGLQQKNVGATTTLGAGGNGELRRSTVANSVQAMEQIATRNAGIGDQIRVVAQNQNKIQSEAEDALGVAQKKSGFSRFFTGPDYRSLKTVEDRLVKHDENLNSLRGLAMQVKNQEDRDLLDDQVMIMEQIKTELEGAITEEKAGFSLFGWFGRMMNK